MAVTRPKVMCAMIALQGVLRLMVTPTVFLARFPKIIPKVRGVRNSWALITIIRNMNILVSPAQQTFALRAAKVRKPPLVTKAIDNTEVGFRP